MTFPVPAQTGPLTRSIAERDRVIVFVTAIGSMLPVSVVLGPAIESPWALLGATFVCSYAAVIIVVLLLRRSFLRHARTSTWTLEPTSRPIPRKAQPRVDALNALGYSVVNVAAVADTEGRVFTKPLVVFSAIGDLHIAIATAHGVQIVSRLPGDAWLVTADTKVVAHHTVIAQTVSDATPATLVSVHDTALSLLAGRGVQAITQPDAMAAAAHLERLEQDILRALHSMGVSPRAAMLLERGATLTSETVAHRIPHVAEGTPISSRS